jgi:hypothetical protein
MESDKGEDRMLFMVIERFERNDMVPIYKRLEQKGRQLPEGLAYVDSWIEANFSRCFQLMECADTRLLQEWVLGWRGTGAAFEIVPVVPSRETRAVVAPFLAEG